MPPIPDENAFLLIEEVLLWTELKIGINCVAVQ